MFGEKEKALKLVGDEPMTILEKDAQFEGKLTFEGQVQINGNFRGEVFSEGTLIIGEGAQVDARVEIDTIIIQGQFNGSIFAKKRVEMHPPACVKGEISSPGLVVSDGAIFEGNCSMKRTEASQIENFSQSQTSTQTQYEIPESEEFSNEAISETNDEVRGVI